jgi:hypothetical protein
MYRAEIATKKNGGLVNGRSALANNRKAHICAIFKPILQRISGLRHLHITFFTAD